MCCNNNNNNMFGPLSDPPGIRAFGTRDITIRPSRAIVFTIIIITLNFGFLHRHPVLQSGTNHISQMYEGDL